MHSYEKHLLMVKHVIIIITVKFETIKIYLFISGRRTYAELTNAEVIFTRANSNILYLNQDKKYIHSTKNLGTKIYFKYLLKFSYLFRIFKHALLRFSNCFVTYQQNISNQSNKMVENLVNSNLKTRELSTNLPLEFVTNQTNLILKDSVICYHCNRHLFNITSNILDNLNLFNDTCEKTSMLEYEVCEPSQECFTSKIGTFYIRGCVDKKICSGGNLFGSVSKQIFECCEKMMCNNQLLGNSSNVIEKKYFGSSNLLIFITTILFRIKE
ncbi:hypothetical protein BpHYR1_011893 [Brachionus plicatilis]|uniref:Uncharacterized protein n=1 Tax=Brachionus plicatilis TaxID=10195 RepID=A0A3M7RCI7_BRAPC|nr:hypothetical protein BpHYR1_011893 [Brachionus plicatilis]